MALSYAPGIARAFDGLERMLIARGEYAQLADLLNGRLEGEHNKTQECAILLKLADLYANQLGESSKATDILYRLLDAMPSADIVSRLLALPQDDDDKKRALYEKAILYCDNCYPYALDLAQYHLKAGRDLQAWAVMSPLRTLLQLDPATKETLNELKNKFEKTEAVPLESISNALPILTDEQFAILDAIKSLAEHMTFSANNIEKIAQGASEVSENTPNGKIFAQMRSAMGLDNVVLYRAAELPEPIVIVLGNPVVVCMRTEIFQKAAGNELQFWLAKAVSMAHPDTRFLVSTPENIRKRLPAALLAAVGIGSASAENADIVQKIKSTLSADVLKEIHTQTSSKRFTPSSPSTRTTSSSRAPNPSPRICSTRPTSSALTSSPTCAPSGAPNRASTNTSQSNATSKPSTILLKPSTPRPYSEKYSHFTFRMPSRHNSTANRDD